MRSRAATISRKHRLFRLIAEALEGRRLFSVSTTLNVSLESIVTLQPAAIHADHVAAAPDGSLWYSSGGTLERVAPAGQTTAYTPAGAGNNQPWAVNSNIVFTADNSAWFVLSNGQSDQLTELASTGSFTSVSALSGAPTHDLTVAQGAVWFTQGKNGIGAYSGGGSLSTVHIAGAAALTGLTTDSAGMVWFTASTASGGLLGAVGSAGESQVQTLSVQPHGLAAGADGSLYFTGPNAIWERSATGVLSQTSVGALSPIDLAPAPDGSVWFIDQAQASRPLWRLGADRTLEKTFIAGAPPLTSLALGTDGALRFTASSDQSAVLGELQRAGAAQNTEMTLTSVDVYGTNDSYSGVANLDSTMVLNGYVGQINVNVYGGTVTASDGGNALGNGNSTVTGKAVQGDDSQSITLFVFEVAPATQPQTPAGPGAPADPSLPRTPATNPAPGVPDDPGSFDGEFTIQPAKPSAPLPPEAPRPHFSDDSYESRGNRAVPMYTTSMPAPASALANRLARPLHTHVSSHREPGVAAALFSTPSVALLTAVLPEPGGLAVARVFTQAPAVPSDSAAGGAAGTSPGAILVGPEPAAAMAGVGDPVLQWWKWTSYVAVAPSLFDRRRGRITRIHW